MTEIPGYTTSKKGAGTGAAGPTIPTYGGTTGPSYIGGGTNVTITRPLPLPFGIQTGPRITVPGYVKGDEVKYLPHTAADLKTLQLSLVQAGYITQAQANQMVLGSPDQITTAAFAKLLATANYSGTQWQNALAERLAAAAQTPDTQQGPSVPPLTISLSNPDDIKATLQKSAQTLLGGNMTDDQANFFVGQFQNAQREQQTAAYNQQYNPGAAAGESGYGPGGTTTAAPDMGVAATNFAKAADPNQYAATQFGASVTSALDKLRTTGYL